MTERPGKAVSLVYTNWQGKTARRRVIPIKIWYGTTQWHQDTCWFLQGVDVEKGEVRDFRIIDISDWSEQL